MKKNKKYDQESFKIIFLYLRWQMATSHRVYSDLFNYTDFTRQVAVAQSKNLLIDVLRDYFRNDTIYRFETDGWGFPLTPNLTDVPPDIQEKRTSRIYIGDIYRADKRFFPSITIRYSSGRYHPVSFNQDVTSKQYRLDLVIDGYGENSYIRTPTHYLVCGAWDQSFDILIAAESIPDREELTDIVSGFLIGAIRQELYEAGLFIKSVNLGGEKEEDFANDKIYMQSITIDTYSEWRREIPIDANSLIDAINFCFNYGLFTQDRFTTDKTTITFEDSIRINVP
ncbi:MAG: hypothetical protein WC516_08255 [Patescibacteria group bacterium]